MTAAPAGPAFGAAIFDVFGTVVDWRSGVASMARDVFAAKRIDADPHDFADRWRGEYQPAMSRVRSGLRGYVPLDRLHRENLDRVLDGLGLSGRFEEAEREALNRAWECLPGWPDSVPGIAAIRRLMLVAPCSNGSIGLMARLARFAGLEWDAILGADVARGYKPDGEVYRRSAEALGLAPGVVLMVAAHEDDLAAARACGLATAFVARPDEHGPGSGAAGPSGDWDFVAGTLEDLGRALARQMEGPGHGG